MSGAAAITTVATVATTVTLVAVTDDHGRVTAPQQYANGNLALLHDALTVLLPVRRISATPNCHMNVVEVQINTSLVQIVDARVADGRQNAAQVGITGIKSGLDQR